MTSIRNPCSFATHPKGATRNLFRLTVRMVKQANTASGNPRRVRSNLSVWITRSRIRVLISLTGGLVIWEIVGRHSSPLIFVPFSETATAFGRAVLSGELIWHSIISCIELSVGFFIGLVVGLVGGLLSAFNRTFRDMTDFWISAAYSTPYVALIPLFIVWFGIGLTSKIALVIFAVFIPVWLNAYAGVTSVDPNLLELAKSFAANRFQTLLWIILPWSLPSLIVGLRLALSRGFIAVIVGELMGATEGLGFLINVSANTFQTAKLLAGVAVLALITIAIVELLKWIQRRTVPWWEIRSGTEGS